MTDDDVKRYGLQDEHVIDVVNTGCIYKGYTVYRQIWDEEYSNQERGLPMVLLVKGDEIRRPTGKEIYYVLALVNGVTRDREDKFP